MLNNNTLYFCRDDPLPPYKGVCDRLNYHLTIE